MNYTNFRLSVRRFFRRNKRLILIIIIIWAVIFFINLILKNKGTELVANTTYELHTSVMDSTVSTPSSMQVPIENLIEEYVGYCNDGNYQKAFNMLSADCQEYEFDNDIKAFMKYVLVKMPTPKKYAIQDYSNVTYGKKTFYVYEIKYTDDLLATGLTNSTYSYTSEKLTFWKDSDGNIQMTAGNYIYHTDIKSISENEYLKIDVVDKVVNYSIETYEVKFTNRSNYTVVIADNIENDEVLLTLPNETRSRSELSDIVLAPQESTSINFVFPKFVDDGDESQSIVFSSIRVMETYSGNADDISDEVKQSEIDNAISKFSMEVSVTE